MEDNVKWKITSNIKDKISQKLQVGSSHNFELGVMWPKQTLQMFQMKTTSNWKSKTTSNGTLPQISSNYWSDLPIILNLGLCDQSKLCKCFKWRQPQIEDDLQWKMTSKGRLPQISKWNNSATTGQIFPEF